MCSQRLGRRKTRPTGRDGFSLVELILVLGIITILVFVSLGPLTREATFNGQTNGMQRSRALALAEFRYANDHNQVLPDKAGGNASAIAQLLLADHYLSDPGLFYVPGSRETKYTGTDAATAIGQANISWDFAGWSGDGVPSEAPDQLPIVWSSVSVGKAPILQHKGSIPITITPDMPFGMEGIAVTYHNCSAKFVTTPRGWPYLCDPSYPGCPEATVLSGGG